MTTEASSEGQAGGEVGECSPGKSVREEKEARQKKGARPLGTLQNIRIWVLQDRIL